MNLAMDAVVPDCVQGLKNSAKISTLLESLITRRYLVQRAMLVLFTGNVYSCSDELSEQARPTSIHMLNSVAI